MPRNFFLKKGVFMKLALSMIILAFSFAAFSADQGTETLGLDLIKLACKNPGAVHNQMPPTDLKVTCREEMCDWVPGPSTYGTVPNWKKVWGSLMTNKPGISVSRSGWGLPCEPTPYACPTLQEECSNAEMVYNVTCDEVMAMTSIKDFCAAKMGAEIAANESILTVVRTGKTQTFCGVAGTVTQK